MSGQFTESSPFAKSAVRKSVAKQKAQEIQARRNDMISMRIEGKTNADIQAKYSALSPKHVKREIDSALRVSTKKAERQASLLRQELLLKYQNLYSIFYPVMVEQLRVGVKDIEETGEVSLNYQNNVAFDNVMRVMREMRELIGTDPDKSLININNTQQNLIIEGDDDPREILYNKILSIRDRTGSTGEVTGTKETNTRTS